MVMLGRRNSAESRKVMSKIIMNIVFHYMFFVDCTFTHFVYKTVIISHATGLLAIYH